MSQTPPPSSRKKHKQDKRKILHKTKIEGKSKPSLVQVEPVRGKKPATIVTFPNGMPVDESAVSFQRFALLNSKTNKRNKLLMGKDEHCTYSTKLPSNQNTSELTQNYTSRKAVGIYDPSKNTLQLYPNVPSYPLTRGVIGYKSSFIVSHNSSTAHMGTYQERRDALFDAFGSSKKKRVLKSMAANVVSMDSASSANALMENVESQFRDGNGTNDEDNNMKVPSLDDVTADAFEEARKKFLPEYNKNSSAPKDVYSAKKIAEEEAWSQISRVVTASKHRSTREDGMTWLDALCSKGKWPDSVTGVLNSISIEQQSALDQIKTSVLIKHMLAFFQRFNKRDFLSGSAEELANSTYVPLPVFSRFLNIFTSPITRGGKGGYCITQQLRDKCVVHMLILFVIAHGPKMKAEDITPLCEDMKVEVPKATSMLREAGFIIRKNSAKMSSATLNVPLKFPPPKINRR